MAAQRDAGAGIGILAGIVVLEGDAEPPRDLAEAAALRRGNTRRATCTVQR